MCDCDMRLMSKLRTLETGCGGGVGDGDGNDDDDDDAFDCTRLNKDSMSTMEKFKSLTS